MSVNTYLSDLAGELVLSTTEKNNIIRSLDTIKRRVDRYFSDVTDKKVFGSYVRGTILPRKADDKSDIDVMIVFSNPNDYKPQSFLNRLKGFAEYYYATSEIYQSIFKKFTRSVNPHIAFTARSPIIIDYLRRCFIGLCHRKFQKFLLHPFH